MATNTSADGIVSRNPRMGTGSTSAAGVSASWRYDPAAMRTPMSADRPT
jgi:hypothetical protein